ncbi:hypothetical protein [Actinacidiphila acidipaludis]|uniref:Uncharacterized protein n=1 Tax=Actinacidiphila acidipaludis TaxID=2873382 RepID=A0ABS7Q724_9ACTN|nr:hypothetical protein [Streptomyces acidipaludis]MBY8878960.1 hypothetical protein [Streptomyces acidipaludis]
MLNLTSANALLTCWLRVRHFAVPPSMIVTATARRHAGDWAGACAASSVDVDFDPRSTARRHGRDLTTRLKADLRHLAPDLLRWHMPRIAPEGLLRPGLTLSLACYDRPGDAFPLHLVVRTPPAWADAGQRVSLALWDPGEPDGGAGSHPHPRPNRRFRLDLHRHLWDARRADEFAVRAGAAPGGPPPDPVPDALTRLVRDLPCATARWAAEAAILLRAENGPGRTAGRVAVRYGVRQRLVLDVAYGEATAGVQAESGDAPRITAVSAVASTDVALPVLPDAATWVPPDLALLRAGLIGAGELHPLVAAALVPGHVATGPPPDRGTGGPHLVDCRGARHRIGLVDGVLAPLDHGPDEIRREELLASLGGTLLPCLQAIDTAHRRPECLDDVRARLAHGDTAGALAVVEALLGPDAVPRRGALRDELDAAVRRRLVHGLYRAGLVGPAHLRGPVPNSGSRAHRDASRARTRHRTSR